ncbi:VOC family protein [Mycobacterium sp. NPDC048908]|uniref:VOC family protein n=1 Tax=Mycobacterium sp. NPDC048908 TaxID=3364292 RepID=UPI003712CE37
MRWRGVSHVEFAVSDYADSVAFYDAMFGWLGYDSFSSLNMEYQSIYYFTRYVNPHSYIGIQPARTGDKLRHRDQAVGINHITLWARSRTEVDRFHHQFLLTRDVDVTDAPKDYPQYWPGYYAVFFDDPINGIHWELAWVPKVPSPRQIWSFYRAINGFARSRTDLARTVPGVMWQARRTLPGQEAATP